jgi:hypothetical protein
MEFVRIVTYKSWLVNFILAAFLTGNKSTTYTSNRNTFVFQWAFKQVRSKTFVVAGKIQALTNTIAHPSLWSFHIKALSLAKYLIGFYARIVARICGTHALSITSVEKGWQLFKLTFTEAVQSLPYNVIKLTYDIWSEDRVSEDRNWHFTEDQKYYKIWSKIVTLILQKS